jgi:hypothetical protein
MICHKCAHVAEYMRECDLRSIICKYYRPVYFRKNLYLILCLSESKIGDHLHKLFASARNIDSIYKVRDLLYHAGYKRNYYQAPLLLHLYGKIDIPVYSGEEIHQICNLFNQIDLYCMRITKRKNLISYSFLIYKIIQTLFNDGRLKILSKYIYMQHFTTLHKSLEIWEKIRSHLNLPKRIGYMVN